MKKSIAVLLLALLITCGKVSGPAQSADRTPVLLGISTSTIVAGSDYRVMITDIEGVILDSVTHAASGQTITLSVLSGPDRIIIVDKRLDSLVIEHVADTVDLEPGVKFAHTAALSVVRFTVVAEILPDTSAGSVTLATGDSSQTNHGTFDVLSSVSLFPVEAMGYRFVGYTGVTTVIQGTVGMLTVRRDEVITATFAPLSYHLVVDTLGDGYITVNDTDITPDSVSYKDTITLVARARSGSVFAGWSGDSAVLGANALLDSIRVVMPAKALHLTARFNVVPSFAISAVASPVQGGTVSPTTLTAVEGSTAGFRASPAKGYRLASWIGAVAAAGTDSAYLLVSDTATVTAVFALESYAVTTDTAGAGTIVSEPGDLSSLAFGTTVSLTATPAAGSIFAGWTGSTAGLDSMSPSISFTVDTARHLTSHFGTRLAGTQVVNWTILTDSLSNAGGTVTRSPDSSQYHPGAKVILTAIPNPGFIFTGWAGDTADAVTSGDLVTMFIGAKDLSFGARFRDTTHPVMTIKNTGTESVTVPSDRAPGTLDTGAVAVDAVDGSLTGSIMTISRPDIIGTLPCTDTLLYIVADPTGNADTLVQLVNRVQATRILTGTVEPVGSGAVMGAGTFDRGSTHTLTARAETGWIFSRWSSSAADTLDTLAIQLDSDSLVTAQFSREMVRFALASRDGGSVQLTIDGRTHAPVNRAIPFDTLLPYGTAIALIALENTANDSESFGSASWILGDDSTSQINATRSFSLIAETVLSARFSTLAKDRFVPTFQTTAGRGTVEWLSAQNPAGYVAGTVIRVRGVPVDGYRFSRWSNVQSILPTSTNADIVSLGDSLVCDINRSGVVNLQFLDTAKPLVALKSGLRDTVSVDSGAVIAPADTGVTASDNDKLAGVTVAYRASGTVVPRIDTLVYTALDTTGNSATARQKVQVRRVLKLSAPASYAFTEGVAGSIALGTSGAGGAVTYTVADPSSQITPSLINTTTGVVSWTPGFALQSAARAVIFTATDALGRIAKDTVSISVINVNRAPIISAVSMRRGLSAESASSEVITVTAADPDGDAVTYAVTALYAPSGYGASASITTSGVLSVVRGVLDSVKYQVAVQDGAGLTVKDTVTLLKPTAVVGLVDTTVGGENMARCMYRLGEPAITRLENATGISTVFVADTARGDKLAWRLSNLTQINYQTSSFGWSLSSPATGIDVTSARIAAKMSYYIGMDSLVYQYNGLVAPVRIGAGTLKATKCDADSVPMGCRRGCITKRPGIQRQPWLPRMPTMSARNCAELLM